MAKKKTGKKDRFVIRGLSLQSILNRTTGGEPLVLRKNGIYMLDEDTVPHEVVVVALNGYFCEQFSGTIVSKGPFEKAYIAIPPSYDVGFQGDIVTGKNIDTAVKKLIKKYGEEK